MAVGNRMSDLFSTGLTRVLSRWHSQWYVANLAAGGTATNYITKGPGFLDSRWRGAHAWLC